MTTIKNRRLRPRAHRFALESRQLFDGAALAETAIHEASASDLVHHESATEPAKALDIPHAATADAASEKPGSAASEVYVIDQHISGWQSLVDQVPQGSQVVIIDENSSGLSQLADALKGETNISAIHILSHGASDTITLGTDVLTADNLSAWSSQLSAIGASLSDSGDILLYGCDVSAQDNAFITRFAEVTQADVAASSDMTGSAALSGDWVLENHTGSIEAKTFAFDYDGLLAGPEVTAPEKGITVAEPSSLNAAGADTATLSGWQVSTTDASETVTVTVSLSNSAIGKLSDSQTSNASLTMTGTASEAQAWLNSITFTSADVELGNTAASGKLDVTVRDSAGVSTSKSIDVTVTPSNDPVSVADATQNVPEIESGGSVITTVTLNAIDAEVTAGTQQPVQIVYGLTDLPQYGYLTLNGDRMGVGSIFTQQDLIDGKVKYVHTATGADQNAADGFTAVINDGATPKAQSDTVHVTLNITPQNQAPTLSGSGVVFEGQPNNAVNTGNVGQYIEADGGGDPGDTTLTLTITALPTHGTLWFNGVAVTVGQTFDYADRNLLTYANDGSENQGTDSFGVRVTDQGGGTGVPASTDGTITLTVRPVDDDPTLDNVTLHAQVDDLANAVTLTSAMIGASDVDSTDNHLSFIVDDSKLTHGYLTLDGYRLQNGGTFTMQDIVDGKVQYVQYASASASGDTDSFNFVVVDNTAALRWNADGTTYSRIGGVYTPGTETLTSFTFTIGLAVVTGGGPGTIPDRVTTITNRDSTWAGVDFTSGNARGEVEEGGTLVLNGTSGDFSSVPGLSYTATGVDASQVVYTFLGFSNGARGGELQKNVGGSWVTLGEYATFTQADLDSGNIRFQHDGGETFVYAAAFSVSAGLTTLDANGNPVTDIWTPTLNIYVTPVNDLPVVTGSSSSVIAEGETAYLTTGQIAISDPDDANSGNGLEESATIKDGSASANNYAYNNDATGANALTFTIKTLPDGCTLQYYNGSQWVDVTVGQTLNASLLTASASTTGLRFVSDGSEVRSTTFTVSATDRWGATSASDATVKIQITNVNDAPQIAKDPTQADPTVTAGSPNLIGGTPVNNPLYVTEGSYGQITSAMLQAYDSDSSSMQLQYTITGAPTHGTLAYSKDGVNFSPIGKGSSFTQQDVANGYIYYLNDGTEGSGNSEPATPDDKFTFTISDGDKEQTGNAFWIYTRPTDDAPEVTAPSGIKNIASATATSNALPGFSVKDGDLTDGVTDGESDYLQVTVRLLHADGSAFVASEYSDVTLGYATGSGATISTAHGGQHDYLVLSGTRAQVNAALAGLTVTFRTDRNATYQVQTIADDRLRDASGTLTAGANGGTLNQPATPGRGAAATAVDATEYNWYSASVPEKSGNLSAASVTIRASEINDPGTLTVTNLDRTVYEDQASFIGGNIVVQDTESAAFGTPVTVTITAPSGTLGIGGADVNTSATASAAGSQPVTISGDNSGTLTLTGRASDIEALLNDAVLGLTWQSGANVNHDLNGAAAGDVTITLHLDDGDSHIGDTVQADPADQTLNLTIVPVNDAPVVSATGGTVYLNSDPAVVDGTKVGGFVISDPDYTDGGNIADGETDFMQVTVRITDASGVPLTAAQYSNAGVSDITISSGNTTSGVTIDSVYNGSESALVIRGTLSQVNAYLAALTVSMTGSALSNADNAWRVEVIADDRLRDASGNLTSANSANGGQNDAVTGVAAVPTTAIDPYGALPSGLSQNVSTAWRSVFPSDVNDPATITVTDKSVNEGSTTVALPAITVADPDADSASLTVTVTLPGGFTFKTIGGTGGTVDAGGVNTTSFTLTGTLSQINSRLANLTVNLPTNAGVTAADWNGTFNVTVVVNDNANHGSRPTTLTGDSNNPNANPGDISYADDTSAALVTTRTFSVTVKPSNDAPVVLDGATQTLAPVSEDTSAAAITGDTIANLFAGNFSDPNDQVNNASITATGGTSADSFWGVAITNLSVNSAQGEWQYSTDGGTTWAAIGSRTDANALLLDATAKVRFVPAADFFGTPAALKVRLVETNNNGDTTVTTGSLTSGQTVSTATNGSSSRYSAAMVTLSTSVTNVNDRPTISATPLTMQEDTPVGKTLTSILGSYSDAADNQTGIAGGGNASGAIGYVAIVGNTTDASLGHWEYSTNGTTWTALGTSYSETNALVLLASTQLRFVPLADYNGAVPGGLTVRVSDSTSSADTGVSAAGSTQDLQSAFNSGQTSHWSTAQSISMSITAVADAVSDTAATHSGEAKTIDVLGNDSFSNSDKAITAVTQGVYGSVVIDNGKVIYTPNTTSYVGSDTFTYTVTSGGVTETATVTIQMNNAAPVTQGENVSTPEDTTLTSSAAQNLLLNDSDPDGDTLSILNYSVSGVGTVFTAGQTADLTGYGKLTINADGSYTFVPVADWNGTVPTVTYRVVDGRTNGATTAQLKITVTPVKDAFDDSLTTHAGTPVTIDVFANDKFSNGDKAITGKTNGAYGTVSISNGQVIYTPTSGYVGTDTFTYTVTSGGKTETATVTLTLVNDAPQVGLAKTGSTAEDTTLTNGENLLTGASDLNGDALTVKSFTVGNTTWAAGQTATLAGYGALTLNADGSYTFVPVADWNGNVPQVTYTITDGRTNGDVTSRLDISVTPVQDAFNDSQTGHGRDPLVIDVFNNDSFANSDKAITATTNGAHGTVTVSNGKVVYTLNDGYVGTDSFTYTVTSGGKTETANVTVTLTNGAPTGVVGKTASTAEDQTLTSTALQNLLNGASDPDGDTLKVSAFTVGATTWAAGQTATLAGYGALTINADGSYTFVPVADWNGSVPQVTYEVTDGRDNGVQTAALDITVTPVQDAHDDSRTAHAGAPVTVDVLTNDGFTNGDKAITGVTDGAHGTVSISNGQVVYTPTSGYVGNDSFTYTVTSGGIEETATVYLTLTNSAPTLPHWTVINREDSPIGIPGLLLDTSSDADGDTLTVTDFTVNGTTWQSGETANLAGYGSLTITSDGGVTFIPVADWNGNVPVVTYTATDGRDNGSVTSTLTIQYDAIPDAVDDNATTHAGVAKVIDVLANDRFSNSDKAVTAVTQGNNGSVAIENGKVRYTPNAGFNGTDSFTYTVTSGGVTETATVNVTIANIAPVAHDDFTWTAEDTTLTRSAATGLLANDSDDDNDALAITQFSTGTQIYAAGQTATLAGMGDLTINADGSYTFVPVADWNGAVQPILYQVSDGNGGFSVATLLLTVNPIADAVNDSVSTHADVPVVIDALDNDSFSNSDQTITGVTAAAHGTVTIENNTLVYRPNAGYVGSDTFDYTVISGGKTETATVTVDVTNVAPRLTSVPTISTPEDTTLNSTAAQNLLTNAHDDDGDALAVTEFTVGGTRYLAGDTATLAGYGDLTIRADGSFTFVPVADWNGVPPAATYTISDGKDGGVSTATLAFSVTPVADAKDDTASTHAGVAVTIDALHNDSFSNADKAIIDVDQGQHGSVTIENGQLVYRPVAGYVGQDTFTYTVESGGVRETANVTVTLTNSVPVATGETVASPEDYEARGDLLLNDRDADGDPLFIAGFTVGGQTAQPGDTVQLAGVGALTVNRDGSYRFTPVADWNGTAPVVTYTVSDGNDGGTATATLAITVTPVADVKDDSATTHAGVPVTIDAIGNDRFVNPDQAITGVTQGAHGSVAIENGQLVYTPNAGYVGQDTFTYTVTSGGVTETAAVSVVMTNTVPVADGEIVTTPEDTAIGGELLTNDRDPDGDPLHIAGFTVGGQTAQPGDTVQLAGVGALTVNRDGSYRFTPVADWNGTAPVVTYTVSDGNDGGTATALLVITVTPVVDVKDDRATTHAGDPVTVDALGNDSFSNADRAITGVTNGAHGTVTIENGKVVYQPNTGYVGQDTFTYTVTSGGVTETAQVTLEVTNTPPVAVADKASTLPETPVSGNLLTNDRDADSDPLHVAEITVGGATYAPGDIITIPGQGTLVVNRDGSYLFTPASGWSGFTPVLNYTLSDGNDGGTATGELRLLVNPVAEAWVKEAGLVDTASGAQTTTGAMAVLSLEPVESLTIGGQTLTLAQLQALSAQAPVDIATPDGVLSLTGFQVDGEGRATLQYRFTLTQAVNQPGESTTREEIRFSVNGQQTRAPGLLRVNILNDAPVAAADDNSIDQDRGQQAASGNVFSNDAIGADGAAAGGPVSAISSVNLNRAGAVGGVSLGEFGALTLDARGNYSYVLNRSNSRVASLDANATLSEVFTYTITDADGNTSQAQLTIVIHGVTPPQSVRTGDQHFPSYYTNYELSLDQPYSPGLFILPAIYGVYSDQFSRKVELNRKITELGRGMNDNGTPVLEDGILFTRWVNTTLQRSVVNTFAATGIGSQLLGDHFSHFSLNKSVQPAPVLENAPERPPLNERINERTTVQQERGEKTPDAKQAHAAAPGVVIVPQAAARPGAPSLAAQVDALARNRVAAPEPVTVGGATPHR
ncbi:MULTISPECIES: Ig-like domain-containing protein [Enterobacter cloacae complex]|uniref:Ig-like domain-containing protein n=1 Tax=Enterobacter cloacae complex TaxID=354276 RepID=UPI001F187A75|nr:Ig-like domain-containing protein [Enterobacter roggenkampii]ELJ5797537.1 tandem-95 repeat protein [Enterobacter roggenkampii]MDV0396189.1 Ig-like domain-containing protein [Enterobacter roggenkampii]MDV0452251.1 Ig-like domain-containing protein [Enterobacter roggenkampii]MDV0481044.1 Ig-like domain-containing protein [Enterobacter roggenkampii]MDV0536110.1 Ig-like domain-containing protein [Enterobacter roggenkampii]